MNRIAEAHTGPPSGFSSPRHRSRSRNPSFSSDRPSTSTISHALMSPPTSVSPEAAFIAASAASQIVTNDHDGHANTWYDQQGLEPSPEAPTVSPTALQLVNNFLDQLLFNVLQLSRSTALNSLRPAVIEVLKPKLAKDAINQADEELREYLGSGDDEEAESTVGYEAQRNWDLELAWKLTRLRCMVYSSLGDMEEGDEDFYMEQDNLGGSKDEDDEDTIISPAVAIFLTSILEFMGEQALIVAGQSAYHRLRTRLEKELRDGIKMPGDTADSIVVEELDMERVALDRTLGRLWRAWKKRMRGPGEMTHRSFSRESLRRRPSSGGDLTPSRTRQQSIDAEVESIISVRLADEKPEPTPTSTTSMSPRMPRYPASIRTPSTMDASINDATTGMDMSTSSDGVVVADSVADNVIGTPNRQSPGHRTRDEETSPQCRDAHPSTPPTDADGVKSKSKKKGVRPRSLLIFPRVPTDIPMPSPMRPMTAGSRSRRRSNSLPPSAAAVAVVAAAAAAAEGAPRSVSAEAMSDSVKSKSRRRRSHRYSSRSSRSMITQDENSIASEADIAEDAEATPKAAAQRSQRRLSKLITSVSMVSSAIANATTTTGPAPPVAAPPTTPGRPIIRSSEDNCEDMTEFTEEPQILTTERVMLRDYTESPALSESSRAPRMLHRSSSVHSARIVDVTPRSPALTRASSLDPLERIRPMAIQASRSTPASPLTEDYSRPLIGPGSRSPAWPPARSLAEVEEEAHPSTEDSSKQAATAMADAMAGSETAPSSRPISVEPVLRSVTDETPSGKQSLEVEADSSACPSPQLSSTQCDSAATVLSLAGESRQLPYSPRRKAYHQQNPQEQQQLQQLKLQEAQQRHQRRRQQEQQKQQTTTTTKSQQQSKSRLADQKPSPTITIETDRSGGSRRDAISAPKPQGLPLSAAQSEASSYRADSPLSATSSISMDRLRAGTLRPADDGASTRSARNFEELIQSDETLQYTLTPENMRDNDAERSLRGESSIISLKRRRSEDGKNRSRSNTSPSEPRSIGSLGRSGSVSRTTGLNSHPVIAVPPMPQKRVGQAREARTPNESVADMAKFFRSTGPHGVPEPAPRQSASAGSGSNSSTSSPHQQQATFSPQNATAQSGRTSAASSRTKLQARDANVERREDTSDLIDFIRRGPPSSSGGNHRIPRTIAPFRTTMDSDQMAGAVGGKAVDAILPDVRASLATQTTNTTDTSMPSSVNSHTALLKKTPPTSTPASFARHDRYFDDDVMGGPPDGVPKRKQRRVRDPYAIDSEDEDDDAAGEEDDELDDLYHSVAHSRRKPAAKEESLAEFLASCEPPPSPPRAELAAPAKPKRKTSAAGLMGRFTRNNNPPKEAAKPPSAYESRSLNSRTGPAPAARGYIPLQVTLPGYDAYGPVGDRPSTQDSGPSEPMSAYPGRIAPHSAGRVTQRRYEAREPQSATAGRTADLADFLRDSTPPSDMAFTTTMVTAQQVPDSAGGFSRMFSRRKKSVAM